jgi:ankyrin repeat protein
MISVMKFLIKDAGADPNVKTNDGQTVLHFAAKNCTLEMVKYLVEETDAGKTKLYL